MENGDVMNGDIIGDVTETHTSLITEEKQQTAMDQQDQNLSDVSEIAAKQQFSIDDEVRPSEYSENVITEGTETAAAAAAEPAAAVMNAEEFLVDSINANSQEPEPTNSHLVNNDIGSDSTSLPSAAAAAADDGYGEPAVADVTEEPGAPAAFDLPTQSAAMEGQPGADYIEQQQQQAENFHNDIPLNGELESSNNVEVELAASTPEFDAQRFISTVNPPTGIIEAEEQFQQQQQQQPTESPAIVAMEETQPDPTAATFPSYLEAYETASTPLDETRHLLSSPSSGSDHLEKTDGSGSRPCTLQNSVDPVGSEPEVVAAVPTDQLDRAASTASGVEERNLVEQYHCAQETDAVQEARPTELISPVQSFAKPVSVGPAELEARERNAVADRKSDVEMQQQSWSAGKLSTSSPAGGLQPLTIQTSSERKTSLGAEHNRLTPNSSPPAQQQQQQQLSSSPRSHSPSLEPVNRQHVEKVAPPEITKNVRRMFETGELADRHEVRRTPLMIDEPLPAESGVFENEPTQVTEGVVRGADLAAGDEAVVQRGLTKSLLNQWKTKGTEQFQSDKRPIVVAEGEGRVVENEPVRREDVVREDDTDYLAGLPSRGQAQLLRQQWASKADASAPAPRDAKALFLADVAAAEAATRSSVLENEPLRRDDVLREEDSTEEVWMRKGYTRDLAGFWAAPKDAADGQQTGPKQQIELPRASPAEAAVIENEPTRLEGVVRSDDSLYEDPIASVEKGGAKRMVGLWQNRQEETKVSAPFRLEMEVKENGGGVYENEPVAREGVVRNSDQVDEVMGQRGLIRNISSRFSRPDADQNQRPRGPPKEMIVIDRDNGPSVLENNPEPVRADVVRSDAYSPDLPPVERGTTRNLVACWKNMERDQTSPQPGDRPSTKVLDLAPEAGVYENEPTQVRADVVRSDEYEPDVIPVARTRSTRAMWSRKEAEADMDSRKAPPAPVRFTPPREVTPPPRQDDYRSFQTLTLSASNSKPTSPGSVSPRSHSPGGATTGDKMTSSTTLVLKSN